MERMMKTLLFCAALLASPLMVSAAIAADAPAPKTEAAPLNGDSPIETIAASAAGKTAMEKHLPGVLPHPAYDQFKAMSLRELQPLSGGLITEEKIAALEAELKSAK
jgi:hypothetical protein